MENITLERAQEIKVFLDSIGDFLPDSVANKLWNINLEVYNPKDRQAYCTCAPALWVSLINNLKRDINQLIDTATIIAVDEQSIVEEEKVAENQDMVPQIKRKAKK